MLTVSLGAAARSGAVPIAYSASSKGAGGQSGRDPRNLLAPARRCRPVAPRIWPHRWLINLSHSAGGRPSPRKRKLKQPTAHVGEGAKVERPLRRLTRGLRLRIGNQLQFFENENLQRARRDTRQPRALG